MCIYLTAKDVGLRGLEIPIYDEALLDDKFADNTSPYLQGQEANLMRAKRAIKDFHAALDGCINWRKIIGFWINDRPTPQWMPDPSFRFIPP